MEYIIKVSDFDKNNGDINSIKPLSCSNDSRWSDDDEYEEQENRKSTQLTTVCGTLDQEATDKPSEDPNYKKGNELKEKCKQQEAMSNKCVNSDELKLSYYKKLYSRPAVSRKSMEHEKTIYEAYTNHVRFSQELGMNLDSVDKLDDGDTLNKIMLNITDTLAKTTSSKTDNLNEDKKY